MISSSQTVELLFKKIDRVFFLKSMTLWLWELFPKISWEQTEDLGGKLAHQQFNELPNFDRYLESAIQLIRTHYFMEFHW